MTPLILTGAIPGLLRRGSPVLALPPHAVVDAWPMPDEPLTVAHLHDGAARVCSRDGDTYVANADLFALDLTNSLGLCTAIIYLGERGHEVPAAWPIEAVAWSVLSVSRGGPMLAGIDDVPKFVNTSSAIIQFCGASLWWTATEDARDYFLGPTGQDHFGWYWVGQHGQEVGDAAIKAVCALALAANYAILNTDGTLTLPPLPLPPQQPPSLLESP